MLSQQVYVVRVGEPCLCLSHHYFPGPLWAPADSVRTPGTRENRKFVNSLWIVQTACKHMHISKVSIFFSFVVEKKRQKINDKNWLTRNPWYKITFISWQRGFGSIECFTPKWPGRKYHPSNKNMLPCIISSSSHALNFLFNIFLPLLKLRGVFFWKYASLIQGHHWYYESQTGTQPL